MSNPEKYKSLRSVADAYVEMRRPKIDAPEVTPEAVETTVETEHVADVADAKVDVVEEEVIPTKKGAHAFRAGPGLMKAKMKSDTAIAKGVTKSKSLMNGEEEAPKKKNKNITINPELSEDGHTDVSSAIRKCKTIIEDAQDIMVALEAMGAEQELPTWWTNKMAVSANSLNGMRDYIKNPSDVKEETLTEKPAGWIAIYNGKSLEIKIDKDAKDLYTAKQFALKHFKVPKSKQGLLAIAPAY